jgi:hypothetical protein
MKWNINADEIRHIGEFLEHLVIAQTDQPDIGPLWRVKTSSADADAYFIEAMQIFDWMLRGASPTRHQALIHLLWQDIEIGPLETFVTHFTVSGLGILWLYDPCLKFLVQLVERMGKRSFNTFFVELKDPWKVSWTRIATHIIGINTRVDLKLLVPLQGHLMACPPRWGEVICEQAPLDSKVLVSGYSIILFRHLCP